MISRLDISIVIPFKKMNKRGDLVDKDAITKLESYIQQYGITEHDYHSSHYVRTIKVETSDCIIKFCLWLSEAARMFSVRLDKNTRMLFYGSYSGYIFTEENMLYYTEKMSHDAIIVCAKSDMLACAKVEFISVAMALFGAKDGKFTKKAK